jgi:hypothetical protein
LFAEAVGAIVLALGFTEGVVPPTCHHVVKILKSATVVSGIAVMADMQVLAGHSVGDVSLLPFEPIFYCALGLYALVGIAVVLHVSCGGGCVTGCAADKRISTIECAAKGVLVIGMMISLAMLAMKTFAVELLPQQTGLRVEWGEPLVAIALGIASLALLTELVEFFSARTDEDASTANEDGAEVEKIKAVPGIAEPMGLITSRASCLILASVSTHIAVGNCPENSPDAYLMTLTCPLRLGFLLCGCVILLQILMLVTFSISTRDIEPAPAPELDATGTLVWDMVADNRSFVLQLLTVGLMMSIVSMGVSAWALLCIVVAILVYPILPQQGKSNVNEALGWIVEGLKSSGGVIGRRLDSFLEQRRKLAEEKAAQRAALREKEMLAAAEEENSAETEKAQKKSKAEPGEPKKKQPNASPKKTAGKSAKKKSSM